MGKKNKIFVMMMVILFSAVVLGCASTSGQGYNTDKNSGQVLTFVLEAVPTASKSQFEFLGEGDITFINDDNNDPFKMEGAFKGGWSVLDSGTTRFYGVCDPDGIKNSGDELAFTAFLYDEDLNGTRDLIYLRVHDFHTGIMFFDSNHSLRGENVKINISEV